MPLAIEYIKMETFGVRNERPVDPLRFWSGGAVILLAAYALLGGVVSFLGWALNESRLTDWGAHGISIQPNAALAVALSGGALVLLWQRWLIAARTLGGIVFLIGASAFFGNVTGIDLGVDTLFLFGREWGRAGTLAPGRMGIPGSVSWIFVGLSVLFSSLDRRVAQANGERPRILGVLLALLPLSISILSVTGYLFGVRVLYTIPNLTVIAFQTATFIFVVSLGLILVETRAGPMHFLATPGAGSSMVRLLIPAVIVIPAVLGFLTVSGVHRGLYDPAFGSAARTLAEIAALVSLLWWAGEALNRQDRRARLSEITARQYADDLVRMANAMPQLVWIADAEGKVQHYNTRVEEFGAVAPNLEYDESGPAVHPDDRDATVAAWKEAVRTSEPYSHEHRILMRDGSYRWHLTRATPVTPSDERPVKWYGTSTDIHDLKMAEEELRRSEERLRLAIGAGNLGTWELDLVNSVLYGDSRARMLFGVGPDDPSPFDDAFWKLIPEAEHPIVRVALKKATDPLGDGVFRVQHRVRLLDRSSRWLNCIGRVEFADDGNKLRAVRIRGTVADITERKQEEMRNSLLVRLGDLIRTVDDPESLMYLVARAVGETFHANRCLFNEIDLEAGLETVHRDFFQDADSVAGVHQIADYSPITLDEMRAGKTVVNVDASLDPRTRDYYKTYKITGERSYIAVPLMRAGVWVASLWVSDAKPREWTTAEVRLIESVGERTWLSVEKLRAENELRTSHERFLLAQKAGGVGVWDWNVESGQTYWSESMWTIYGEPSTSINPDEEFWSSRLHPDDRDRVKRHLKKVVDSDKNEFRDEFRIIVSDGSVRWIQSDAMIERDHLSRALRVYGVNIDITRSKNAEQTALDREKQVKLITDTVPALISYIGADEKYRFVNGRYCEWFRKETEEMLGRTIAEIEGKRAYKVLKPYIDKVLAGETVYFEATLTYKSAGERTVGISYVPHITDEGGLLGFYALISDLTELRRSEDLLRSSEERMALLLETLTDYAILTMDAEGKIDSWNRGAELIFGYPSDEIMGKPCEILFTPEDVERGVPAEEMRVARELGRASDDRWHMRKDGTRFYASGVMIPLHIGSALHGYAKIASDLTEKKRQAEGLQRSHDLLEMRVADRTRELAEANEALRQEMRDREIGERQRIQLLQRLVTSQEFERTRIARDIHDTLGQRLTALRLKIASLGDVSADPELKERIKRLQEISEKLDAEVSFLAWELRPTALDDLGFVQAIGEYVREWSRHVEIEAEFHASETINLRLDPETETHLYRITQEALNNVAKHSRADHVAVQIEKRGDSLILIIEDNGIGFDPGDPKHDGDSNGGLGLTGMGERAGLIHGDLEIESSPGKGTTIFVRVPFGEEE